MPARRARFAVLCLALCCDAGLQFSPTAGPAVANAGVMAGDAAAARMPGQITPEAPLPAPREGQVLVATFEFGAGGRDSEKFFALRAAERDCRFGWYGGRVSDSRDPAPVRRGRSFVQGEDALFMVGISDDDLYRVVLTLDGSRQSGAVSVIVQDSLMARVRPGKQTAVPFDARPVQGCLSFRLRADSCGLFALSRVQVFGPPESRVTALFPGSDGSRSAVPPPDSLAATANVSPRDQLRKICEYLVQNQTFDGGFSSHGAWYENSFALRALLAGGTLLNEPAWREASFKLLDRFVSLQRPDGNWVSGYSGHLACESSASRDSSANLADIGTMTLCLSMAAPLAEGIRRERYLAAVTLYSDSIVLPSQLPSGAFPNRLWRGQYQTTPYSVATATQASSLALLHAATGKVAYLEASERAAAWLAGHVRDDGSFDYCPNDTAEVRVIEAADFGNLYYVMEALSIVSQYARENELRSRLDEAVGHWIFGSHGLAATAAQGYWWAPGTLWAASKMAGVPFILARYGATEQKNTIELWNSRALAWLADPGLSIRAGVMAHPAGPFGDYALPATGFAGIGIAAMIDPAILVPPAPAPR